MAEEGRRGTWNYLNTHPTSDEHGKAGKSLYSPTELGASATFLTPHSAMLPTDDAVSAPALSSATVRNLVLSLHIYSRNGICKFQSTHNQGEIEIKQYALLASCKLAPRSGRFH